MYHFPKFWKHKDTKEVIDHQTYSDLPREHRANFDECDVTGEIIQAPAVYEQKEGIPVLSKVPANEPTSNNLLIEQNGLALKAKQVDTTITLAEPISDNTSINFAPTTDASYIGGADPVEEEI